jgi:hypothetical protein
MGVPVWELENKPIFYMEEALLFQDAEEWAEAERLKRNRPMGTVPH